MRYFFLLAVIDHEKLNVLYDERIVFQNKVIMNSVAFLSMHSFIRNILTSDISTKYQWCIQAEMIEEKVEKIAQMRSKTMNAIKYYHDVVVEEENSGSWIDHIMYLWGKAALLQTMLSKEGRSIAKHNWKINFERE